MPPAGFTPRRKERRGRKVAPPPTPPRPKRGVRDSPPWIRRGQGWLISGPVLCFHTHSRFVSQKTSPDNQLAAPDYATPGWRRPRCVGLRRPEGTGQAERHNLTARSARADPPLILAYKLRCSLPRNFPVAGYLGASTDGLKGWCGPEHLGDEPQSPNTRDSDALHAISRKIGPGERAAGTVRVLCPYAGRHWRLGHLTLVRFQMSHSRG